MKKRLLSILLITCVILGICAGCTTNSPSEVPTEDTGSTDATEPPLVLTLDQASVTLSAAGDTVVVYSGTIDVTQIAWSSDDTSIAAFINGTVHAIGRGETVVHAEYGDQKVSCTVVCDFAEETEPEVTEPEETKPEETNPSGTRSPVLNAPTEQVVDSSFFDDAAFIGDSVSLMLSYYASDSGELGSAKFLVRGSYGVTNAVFDYMLMTYQGQEMKIEDAVAATGAKKVFIMLGMNDIAAYGIDATMTYWGRLLTRIRSTCPDIEIYIQSMTPIWTGGEKGSLNNTNVDKYNNRLQAFAAENGCKYIDVASYMKDETGGLATSYCSDSYVHLTYAATERWVKVLKAYTGYFDSGVCK